MYLKCSFIKRNIKFSFSNMFNKNVLYVLISILFYDLIGYINFIFIYLYYKKSQYLLSKTFLRNQKVFYSEEKNLATKQQKSRK
jgi:hypothetical protein